MDKKSFAALFFATVMVAATGCGGGKSTTGDASQDDGNGTSTASHQSPEKVVGKFLSSLRDGDHEVTVSLLTAKAVEETSKNGFSLNEIGTPTLEFDVGKTRRVAGNADRCQVPTNWKDSSGDASYEIVWLLKKSSAGWKIAGMTTPVFVGQAPIVFNFENGEDFLRKWSATDEEIARREQGGARTVESPQNGTNTNQYR